MFGLFKKKDTAKEDNVTDHKDQNADDVKTAEDKVRDTLRVHTRNFQGCQHLLGKTLPDRRNESRSRSPQPRSDRGLRAATTESCAHYLGVGQAPQNEFVDDNLAHDHCFNGSPFAAPERGILHQGQVRARRLAAAAARTGARCTARSSSITQGRRRRLH